jgi:hypothetical protein
MQKHLANMMWMVEGVGNFCKLTWPSGHKNTDRPSPKVKNLPPALVVLQWQSDLEASAFTSMYQAKKEGRDLDNKEAALVAEWLTTLLLSNYLAPVRLSCLRTIQAPTKAGGTHKCAIGKCETTNQAFMVPNKETGVTCKGNRLEEKEGECYGSHQDNPTLKPPHYSTGYMASPSCFKPLQFIISFPCDADFASLRTLS